MAPGHSGLKTKQLQWPVRRAYYLPIAAIYLVDTRYFYTRINTL